MLRNEISNEKDLLNIKSLHITKSINLMTIFIGVFSLVHIGKFINEKIKGHKVNKFFI